MLEDALRDDRTDVDNESTADLVSQIGRGLRGVNLNAPSLATESMYGDEYNDQSDDYGGDSDPAEAIKARHMNERAPRTVGHLSTILQR